VKKLMIRGQLGKVIKVWRGTSFLFQSESKKYWLDREDFERRLFYLRGWIGGHNAVDGLTATQAELDELAALLEKHREWTWEDWEQEDRNTVPDPDEYGCCDMCKKPMGGFDAHHSQGNHCAGGFEEVQGVVEGGKVNLSLECIESPPAYDGYEQGRTVN
jgi:hypothetical protein